MTGQIEPNLPPSGTTSTTKKEAKAQAAANKAYAKSQRNWFARHKLLTALLAVVAIIIIIMVARGGGGTTPSASTASPSAESAATQGAVSGLNQAVRDGKFEFTVNGVDCGKVEIGSSGITSKAQGEFCLVKMHVENIGTEAQLLDGSSQQAFDSQGRKFSADTGAAIYLQDAKTFLNRINPGNAVDGTVVFDVPKGVKITQLELHDSAFSGGAKIKVG